MSFFLVIDGTGIFSHQAFKKYKSTYKATEVLVREMTKLGSSKQFVHPHSGFQYLLNEEKKTVILLKTVVKAKITLFHTKKNVRFDNPYDNAKMGTSDCLVKAAILYFLNHVNFSGYAVGVSIGKKHECCVFFLKIGAYIDVIYYNPNFSRVQQEVQSSKLLKSLVITQLIFFPQ